MSISKLNSEHVYLNGNHTHDFVLPEQYGLPKSSAEQKLSPLDMNMPRLYGTRWILCFPLSADAEKIQIYEDLKAGLAHTIAAIPWIAGNVASQEGCDPEHNRIQVVDGAGGVMFRFKDLTKILPSYVELRAEHFPLAKLPTAQLSPVNVLPQPPQPVMAAQANFIEGGLLLTIAVHHSVCDGSGVDTIMDNWANNTAALGKGASFTQHDHPSNDRSRLMTGNPGANLANYPEYILTPSPRGTSTDVNTHQMAEMPFQLPPMTAHIFYFSPESLAVLKHSAASHSTNDALMAFTWKHMTLARNPPSSTKISSSDEDKTSALLFAANIRDSTSPPLPVTYLGNASMAVITERLLVSTLTSNSGLAQAAAAIRTSITALKTPDRVSLTIGLLNSRPDPTDFKFAYNAFLGPDVSATSWAKFGIYERSWGVLGKPESFRIPGEGADGVIIVFPQLNEGGLEVMIGLENSSVKRLLANGEFAKAATLWG